MRNMSFALTEEQLLDGTKHVTRRLGWLWLKHGDIVQPVRKSMGLRKGESVVKLGSPIATLYPRREPLSRMLDDRAYGQVECSLEGFPELSPEQFVSMFCRTHRGCTPDTVLTRIAFDRINKAGGVI